MKSIIIVSVFLFSSLGFAAGKSLPNETAKITIGMIPGGNPEKLRLESLALAEYLQGHLNIAVNIYISKDYQGLMQAMKDKKVDFAFFNPTTYVDAEKSFQAKVLLKKVWDEPFYYSTVIVPQESKVKTLQDLKLKSIAFVDKHSASGYLYPKVAFLKEGIQATDFKQIHFTANHQASIALLESGKVDAAAVFSDDEAGEHSAWKIFSKDPSKKYRMLWLSEPIPNDAFCVRNDFYEKHPKLVHSLMFSLIELFDDQEKNKLFKEIVGSKGLVPATSKQYDVVREMMEHLKNNEK